MGAGMKVVAAMLVKFKVVFGKKIVDFLYRGGIQKQSYQRKKDGYFEKRRFSSVH
jgi:hypothetical protein